MPLRQKNILLCFGALVLGALVYILFRPNTHIAHLFDGFPVVIQLREGSFFLSLSNFDYYVPDLLWSFALSCGIQAICEPEKTKCYVCALVALSCGVAWEILQWCDVVSGTGDFLDILMYLAGSVLSILINIKGEQRT
jgi:hypothetical protein